MSESSPPRRPALALFGYVAGLLPLIAIIAAFQKRALDGVGWRGGQYAEAFLAVTTCAIMAGAVLRARQPDSTWRSFGLGMILAGVTGTVMVAIILTLVGSALSHFSFTF